MFRWDMDISYRHAKVGNLQKQMKASEFSTHLKRKLTGLKFNQKII